MWALYSLNVLSKRIDTHTPSPIQANWRTWLSRRGWASKVFWKNNILITKNDNTSVRVLDTHTYSINWVHCMRVVVMADTCHLVATEEFSSTSNSIQVTLQHVLLDFSLANTYKRGTYWWLRDKTTSTPIPLKSREVAIFSSPCPWRTTFIIMLYFLPQLSCSGDVSLESYFGSHTTLCRVPQSYSGWSDAADQDLTGGSC